MESTINRLADKTIEITVEIPWPDIKQKFEQKLSELVKLVEVSGFRKGNVPVHLAQKQIKKDQLFQEVLKDLLPQIYSGCIKTHQIQPIVSPQIKVLQAEENQNWRLMIRTCEKPKLNLGNYRQAAATASKPRQSKIWVPGSKDDQGKKGSLTASELLDALYQEIKIEIPAIMLEQEVERMLANAFDQLQKLGLTVEKYLQAQGKTQEQLLSQYREQARKSLSLEFALEEIAELEKITVETKEIDDIISKAKDDQERKILEQQRYYLSQILRKQKTINHLLAQKPTVLTS